MSNRSIVGGLAALFLMALLCVCVVAASYLFIGTGTLAFAPFTEVAESIQPQADVRQVEAAPVREVREQVVEVPLPEDALLVVRAEEEVLNSVYEAVSPSVVNIEVSGDTGSLLGGLGQGSGFVWDAEGHIVTNNHVVATAETVIVTFPDNVQVPAEVVGTDPASDLAVLRVDVDPELLRPVALGQSSALRVGQRVIAIGNPFGFDQTLTLGVVSAVGRTVPGQISEAGAFALPNLVQTDAAINPGNSGGPLLDIEGRVVGVNTLIFSSSPAANSGVGFAVPVDKVQAVVPSLIATGEYETPYLGVSALPFPLTPELASTLELEGVASGILIQEVSPGGPAAEAGLRGGDRPVTVPGFSGQVQTGGDVVIAIDDQPIREFDDLVNYLDTRTVGDTVTLLVIRDGERVEIPVTVGARP